jgi:hypothetical protein
MKATKFTLMLCITLMSIVTYSQNAPLKMESLPIDSKTNCFVRYYYFPNLQAYFDNLKMVYYYKENNQWQTAAELPTNYGGYSLYNKWKVMITDFDGENPQELLKTHKKLYPYNSKGRFSNATASTN